MRKDDQITAMVTGAIILSAGIVGWYYVSEFLTKDYVASCAQSATEVSQLNITRVNGEPMTPIELHSYLGHGAIGILKSARVVNVNSQPSGAAIEVDLPKGSTSPRRSTASDGGIVFDWAPKLMGDAHSACLSYAIKVPVDFEPGKGGTLPGLFGGATLDDNFAADGTNGFAIRTVWDRHGDLKLYAQVPPLKKSNPVMLSRKKFKLQKGTWVKIDQELTLNTPGQHDGVYRIWIDGDLKYQHKEILWRTDPTLRIQGASGAAHYGTPKLVAKAPSDTVISLTPFELSTKVQ